MTPATVFPDVRVLINDTDSTAYRYSDSVLLTKLDTALKRVALLRPDLFTTIAAVSCTVGSTIVTVPNHGKIVEVYQVVGGLGVSEVNREQFDITYPAWRSDTPAAAVNWMRHARNPSVFFIYPPAPASQQLLCEYTASPTVSTTGDTIAIDDVYLPAVQDMLVAVVEWGDDEHNLSQRAETFYKRAVQLLTTSKQVANTMDMESGGEPPMASLALGGDK